MIGSHRMFLGLKEQHQKNSHFNKEKRTLNADDDDDDTDDYDDYVDWTAAGLTVTISVRLMLTSICRPTLRRTHNGLAVAVMYFLLVLRCERQYICRLDA